jgi:hypothetical protein
MFVISTNGVVYVVGVDSLEVVVVHFVVGVFDFLGALVYRSLVCLMDFLFALLVIDVEPRLFSSSIGKCR